MCVAGRGSQYFMPLTTMSVTAAAAMVSEVKREWLLEEPPQWGGFSIATKQVGKRPLLGSPRVDNWLQY